MRITFTKSPTGAFKLGYSEGDTVDLNDTWANEIINAGFAFRADQPEMSIEQIKVKLVNRGIKFNKDADKGQLMKLLYE